MLNYKIDSQQGIFLSVKLTKFNLTAACVNCNSQFKKCSGDLGFLECLCQIDLLNLVQKLKFLVTRKTSIMYGGF